MIFVINKISASASCDNCTIKMFHWLRGPGAKSQVNSGEKGRIQILMMTEFGDRTRTHQEVFNLFTTVYPNRQPITRLVVIKTLWTFNIHDTYLQPSWRVLIY